MTDIIDEIDALVDEQLSGYSQRTGYDYNASQDRCWHCGEDWHGLKITARMEEMRQVYQQEARRLEYLGEGETGYAESVIDPDYRYADDDSDVLCPGSSFIGPWATKAQIDRMRTARFLGDAPSNPWIQLRSPGDPMIESAEWATPYSLAAPQQIRDANYAYAFPQRVVLGVDVSAGGTTEVSQVIIDEGRPYRYGEDFSFADQRFPPEVQFPREWPDFAGALRRILEIANPFDPAAWIMTVGDSDPEPDTRTPQERALPRPSTTPPMWAVDAGRQRRTRTNSRRRHR